MLAFCARINPLQLTWNYWKWHVSQRFNGFVVDVVFKWPAQRFGSVKSGSWQNEIGFSTCTRCNTPSCKNGDFASCQIARLQEIVPKNSTIALIAGNCQWKIKWNCYIIFCATKREQKQPCWFSHGCFHLTKSFSKNSHGAVGNGNRAAVEEWAKSCVCTCVRERPETKSPHIMLPCLILWC